MIIGSGLMARSFHAYADKQEIVVFASGVSNSKETNPAAFDREKDLLSKTLETLGDKKIIYFSTCSIEDPSLSGSAYVQHKKMMEQLIAKTAADWHVFRLPQVVGPTESPTLVHFLFDAIAFQKPFLVQTRATRNLIWHEDIYKITAEITPDEHFCNQILNIASPFHLKVSDIVAMIEEELHISAHKTLINEGGSYMIDTIEIERLTTSMNIFSDDYPREVIRKYGRYFKEENR